jgi:hypothetical protein
MESFTFLDDTAGNIPLAILKEFTELPNLGTHKPIQTEKLEFWGIAFIDLDWTRSSQTADD